jgi:hypothetical protein
VTVAKLLLRGPGHGGAMKAAQAPGTSERVRAILQKAAIAGALGDPWGSGQSEFHSTTTAFLNSLRGSSAFDSMLGSMRRVPFRSRVVTSTTAATGEGVAEGAAKPVSSLALTATAMVPQKAVATLVVNDELMDWGDVGLDNLIQSELRAGVVAGTDSIFVTGIVDGINATVSTGVPSDDVAALLAAVRLHAAQRLFWVAAPDVAAAASTGAIATGGPFPVAGGTFVGLPFIMSDAVDDGTLILADASQFTASDGGVVLDTAEHASVEVTDEPTQASVEGSPPAPAAAQQVSLWQVNARALRAERWFSFRRNRADAVALMESIDWGTPA